MNTPILDGMIRCPLCLDVLERVSEAMAPAYRVTVICRPCGKTWDVGLSRLYTIDERDSVMAADKGI